MTVDEDQAARGPAGEHRLMSQRRDLERYAALFASRTAVMKSSAMRDLMAITERPEVISLAGGLPDTSTFPAETLAAMLSRLAAADSARALQYGPTEGMAAVARAIATVMEAEDTHVDPEDVIVTSGGQQVIDLVCKTLVDPGDVIVAEAPTYPGAVPAFSAYQADVVQIAMDDDGMRVDELEDALERLEREGRRPKFIYTIPNFQNPAGVTMSVPRRKRLVAVAHERELLVLEDNPYGLLRYEGDPLPTLRSLDGGHFVIYLGTFSKILSPGIRVGWAVAPGPVLEKMNLGKQASDLCSSSLSQLFVSAYFAEGSWTGYLASLRDLYRRRRDTMLDALAEHLPPEASWTRPRGGLFIWATLPDYIDTTDLLARALSRNVAFVPGRAAFLDGRGGSSLRLNFSGVGAEDIHEGVRRIGEVVREQVDLYSTLTGTSSAPQSARARREPDAAGDPVTGPHAADALAPHESAPAAAGPDSRESGAAAASPGSGQPPHAVPEAGAPTTTTPDAGEAARATAGSDAGEAATAAPAARPSAAAASDAGAPASAPHHTEPPGETAETSLADVLHLRSRAGRGERKAR